MRKLLAIATISTVAGVGAVAGIAGNASAADGSGVITKSTVSYTDPTTNSVPVHHFDKDDVVATTCWTNGEHIDGSYTWLRVRQGGTEAFVHRGSINPPAGLEHC